MKIFVWFIVTLLGDSFAYSAKIVAVFSVPLKSHTISVVPLLRELASRGHNVTFLTCYPTGENITNYEEVHFDTVLPAKNEFYAILLNQNYSYLYKMLAFFKYINSVAKGIWENANFQAFLTRTNNVDLMIINGLMHEAWLGMAYRFNASGITFSARGSNSLHGNINRNHLPYAYVPNTLSSYTDRMTFKERLFNTVAGEIIHLVTTLNLWYQNYIVTLYFPEAPPLHQLMENVTVHLYNTHFSLETTRPYLPGSVDIGGYYLFEKREEEFSQEVKEFLDQATDLVFYFSLGTNIDTNLLPTHLEDIIFTSLNNSGYYIIMKYDVIHKDIGDHFYIQPWLPQRQILKHPNLKAFITHGGLGSIIEAIVNGIPMIGIPFFSDQKQNMRQAVERGYGIYLDATELDETKFSQAIQAIVTDSSYKINMDKQRNIFNDRDINPMEKAIYWVEYAIQHRGAPHLKGRIHSLPMYQYLLLDIICFILIVCSFSVFLIYYVLSKIIILIRKYKSQIFVK